MQGKANLGQGKHTGPVMGKSGWAIGLMQGKANLGQGKQLGPVISKPNRANQFDR